MAGISLITTARFWSKVDVPDDDNACWEWRRAFSKNGYGSFWFQGASEGAHRVAYLMAKGDLPPAGMVVRHTCDNPKCVNPYHLLAGTKKENFQDYMERGEVTYTGRTGEENGRAKLNAEQVEEVRKLIAIGMNNTQIAKRFGVTHSNISAIRLGKSWNSGPVSVPREKSG